MSLGLLGSQTETRSQCKPVLALAISLQYCIYTTLRDIKTIRKTAKIMRVQTKAKQLKLQITT